MELWTIQMAQWRKAKELDISVVNTTVKTGNYFFAPSWDMVTAYKSGEITSEAYTEQYLAKMRASYRDSPTSWMTILNKPKAALACYCKAGEFCHRHLLANMMLKVAESKGLQLTLKGELI